MMKKSIQKIVWGGVGVAVLYYLIVFFSIIPWEVNEIKDTMRRQMVISAEAYETLDPSSFVKVYANEPGACVFTEAQFQQVRFVYQVPNLQQEQIGLFDVRTAEVLVLKQAVELSERITTQMMGENRFEMNLEELTVLGNFAEESGGLMLTPAVSAYPPPVHKVQPQNNPIEQTPTLSQMLIVPLNFSRARIYVGFSPLAITSEYTLILIEGQWLIVCEKINYRSGGLQN